MLYIFVFLIFIIVLIFLLRESTLKKEFQRDLRFYWGEQNKVWEEKELPELLKRYLEYTGLVNEKDKSIVHISYQDVSFSQSKKGPVLKMEYEQYNFVNPLRRLAYMKSSMFGIPFEGYDTYHVGKSSMRGVIGKYFPLFDQKEKALEEGNLVTILAESLFLPNLLFSENIHFEKLNEHQIKGELKVEDIRVSGIFTFNEKNEYVSFYTDTRAQVDNGGNIRYAPWQAICEDYQKNPQGYCLPSKFKAIWKEEEDFVYFDGLITSIEYKK
ncbi:MAG: hypothetical protein Q4C49_10185 [Bacillota bacterium]|nr:hypothetical protein [Bacillota bacterium]